MGLVKHTSYHKSVPSFVSDPFRLVDFFRSYTSHPHRFSSMENTALQDFMTPLPFGVVFRCGSAIRRLYINTEFGVFHIVGIP